METIRKADPLLRRAVQRWVVIAALAGLPLILVGLPALTGWLAQQPAARALELTGALLAALPMPLVVFGLYLVGVGRQVLRSGQYPPPELRVVRDTPVRTGRSAGRFGHGLIASGLALALLALASAVGLPYLLFAIAHR